MGCSRQPTSSIRPYDKNPRKNDAAVEAVARSLTEFGWRQPIVVDESGVIVVGHTRWKAAQRLGIGEVPVHVAVGLSAEKAKAYRIADNATAGIAEWDGELLPIELTELKDLGVDLEVLGFDGDELAALMHTEIAGLVDPDDVPAPPDEATTRPGDLWVLAEHRLLCGDSASAADVDRLLDGAAVQLCQTDPPYNVKVEPRSNNAIAAGLSSFSAPESGRGGTKGRAKGGGATHHQKFDVERHPEKAKGTTKQLRPKDRPVARRASAGRRPGGEEGHRARAREGLENA